MSVSILLVDDHPVFRKGLRIMLEEEEDFRVVGEAGDGEEAVEQVRQLAPDLVVMDITMPNVDGIEATRRIVTEFPGVKVLPLSIHGGKRFVENILRAGAAGYVLKESAPEDLVEAIRKVHGGDIFLSQAVSGIVVSEYMRLLNRPDEESLVEELTADEVQILRFIREGYAFNEVAIALEKSVSALRAARQRLIKKLGLRNATELVEYAAAERWAEGESRLEVSAVDQQGVQGGMPILVTKFYPPSLPSNFVSRQRLVNQLEANCEADLTLLSAPAGYGKSSLLAEWMTVKKRPTVWLSLDGDDSDPHVFLTYLVMAVEAVFPGITENTRTLLQGPQSPPSQTIVSHLVNDLASIQESFDLVLEDYHFIRGEAVHELLTSVFRHSLKGVRWIIVTRHDPPLPLVTLRAASRLHEIRLEDLKCNEAEAKEVMNRTLGRELESKIIQPFCDLAEGWITALRLAAFAIAHHDHPESIIEGMEAAPFGINEYLSEQVLAHQEPEVLDALRKTSVLDRFCAPLSEAVCQNPRLNGEEFIARLNASGLFVIAMDASGTWYRFHHLFHHLLEQKLAQTTGVEELEALHGRASHWLEENGLIGEALTHAGKDGKLDSQADIVERHLDTWLNVDKWQQVERWLEKIPESLQRKRPKLLLAAACVAVERSRLDKLPALIESVEASLNAQEEELAPGILGTLNLFRGQMQFWQGEPERALKCFLEARKQLSLEQEAWASGENELHIALALQAQGRAAEARDGLTERMQGTGSVAPVYRSRLVAAQVFVDLLSGELASAAAGARHLEKIGKTHSMHYATTWGFFLRTLVQFQWFDLDAALRSFSELTEKTYSMHSRAAVDTIAGFSLTCQAKAQPNEAMRAARTLSEFADEGGDQHLIGVAASFQARLSVWQGDVGPSVKWQRSFREPLDIPSIFCWLEIPAITECRVLIAQGRESDLQQASKKLKALRTGLSRVHNTYALIDILVLQAVVLDKLEQGEVGLEILADVVEMAEPGGWIRPFAEVGSPLLAMLRRLEPREQTAEFVSQLIATLTEGDVAAVAPVTAEPPLLQPLLEPLTNRELDVLEAISKRLYDKEIADQLQISPGTVKSHLKHIYQKLDVGNRRQAVEKAQALGII